MGIPRERYVRNGPDQTLAPAHTRPKGVPYVLKKTDEGGSFASRKKTGGGDRQPPSTVHRFIRYRQKTAGPVLNRPRVRPLTTSPGPAPHACVKRKGGFPRIRKTSGGGVHCLPPLPCSTAPRGYFRAGCYNRFRRETRKIFADADEGK